MNDVEMLNSILRSAEMGCQGVEDVRKGIGEEKSVNRVLGEQLNRYGKIYRVAANMLLTRGAEIKHISPVAKKLTRLSAKRDLRLDNSSSHVAEMMIKGNTMGVNKLAGNMRKYDKSDPNITLLAKKLMDTEEEHIREMRAFL